MNAAQYEIIIGNYRYSSWSMRGWLAAQHSGLPIVVQRIALFTEDNMAKLRDLVPSGLVPALVHHTGGARHVVSDSAAIIDFLARLTPDIAWWPEDLAAYGYARTIAAEMHSGFPVLRTACPMNVMRTYSGHSFAPALQADIDKVTERWTTARTHYADIEAGPYLFGAWSGADIMFAPVVTRFKTYGVPLNGDMQAYADAVLAHPDVRRWHDLAAGEAETLPRYEDVITPGAVLGEGL